MSTAIESTDKPVSRFLIVDDSRAIQAIIRRVVEGCGYPAVDVRVAINGEAALDVLQEFTPNLVITDWHMPRMSGLELLQALRQLGKANVPVGLITTETSPGLLDEARRNGAVFVLNKPFKDHELISQLQTVVPLDGQATSAAAPASDAAPAPAAPTAPEATPSAPTPAEAPPPPAAPLVTLDDCKAMLEARMNGIPFRLLTPDPLSSRDLTPQNLLALYGGKTKPVTCVGVLDARAVCIVGGGALKLPPADVRAAMQAGQPSAAMVEAASQFLKSAGALVRLPGEAGGVPMSRASLVPKGFQKLEELLVRQAGRADFRISVPGYGDGRFSFLRV